MAILTSNIYTANHHLDLFANHECGLLRGGVACEFTRKSCIHYLFFTSVCVSLIFPLSLVLNVNCQDKLIFKLNFFHKK